MRLTQVQSAPLVFDTARGAEARSLFENMPAPLLDLLAGAAGSSAYLSASIHKERAWLADIADHPVQESFEALLEFDISSFSALSNSMRIAKRRAALLIALADLGGLWSLMQITTALTRLADATLNTGLQFLIDAEIARGKLPEASNDEAAGMFVLAMGKMGAFELNYSSDIDLIVLFDETRHARENWGELRAGFIRVTKRLIKLLSENTGEGYVFRTDLRLRPDASVTPVCIATEPAERYYESLGRTWERAAYIKARACAGAIGAGEEFLQTLTPFVWRRQLDYAAIEDAHDMRLKIRDHKGLHGPIVVAGHNVKLGQGGIREIEFFAQTQQMIMGGKDRKLRQRGTVEALTALADQGRVPRHISVSLIHAYRELRTLEHRIQMMDDAQTHIIPEVKNKRMQLAALAGFPDLESFDTEVLEQLKAVQSITESFFHDEPTPSEQPEWRAPERANQITENWSSYPALRSERARRIFSHLKPKLLSNLCKAANPDEALLQFDAFLRGLPAGVQVFSLFKARPELLELLIDISTMAPELGRYLGQNPRVLEAVIGGEFYRSLPSLAQLKAMLIDELAHADDYEQKLDVTRIWAQEMRFRAGVQLLRGVANTDETALAYSNIAEACVVGLFDAVVAQFSLRHGPPPGKGAAVIAMGKLGSREMTVSSDLDIIVVYDADGETQSSGKRPLSVAPYYARLTQSLVSALTVSTSKGGLFEVDMRLRPSGRQGPVATSLSAFDSYQKTKAWDWEHMALLRARVIAGPIAAQVEAVILDVLRASRSPATVMKSLKEMRQRLAEAKSGSGVWDVKNGAGGLMDIELLVQAGGLIVAAKPGQRVARLARAGWLDKGEVALVTEALNLYHSVQQISRLALRGVFDPKKAGSGAAELLIRITKSKDLAGLEAKISTTKQNMDKIISHRLKET